MDRCAKACIRAPAFWSAVKSEAIHRFGFGSSRTRNAPASHVLEIQSGDSADSVAALQNLAAGQDPDLPITTAALLVAAVAAAVTALIPSAKAAESKILLRVEGPNTLLRVQGGKDDEWRFQTSSDLLTWSNAPALGTVFSAGAEGRDRTAASSEASRQFFRAVKTDGLFDPLLLRNISLTFTQANWQTLLANGRMTGSNTLGTLNLDNGLTNSGIGARYRGNTSYDMGGAKKSLNLEINFTNSESRLMGYKTVNLNNAAGDKTVMREPLYFNVMRQYAPCPKASLVKLDINGQDWGVYSFVQQENSDLIDEWFPSNDGDRWQAPNVGGATGLGAAAFAGRPNPGGGLAGGPGGGVFGGPISALSYRGTNIASYRTSYELKTDHSTNAWERLVHAIDVLNNTPSDQLRDKVEDVLAVDRWLWFLAVENIFADDDSYWRKGADYGFYFEPESGRFHPLEHDGNEAFVTSDVQVSPVQGAANADRPVLYRLLSVPELRQRYLAHIRTVLEEFFNPTVMNSLIDQLSALSLSAITADTKKNYTMQDYNSALAALKTFIRQRHAFLTNHAELRPLPPKIVTVHPPAATPKPDEIPFISAQVVPNGTNGIDSVWLYYRNKSYGRFAGVRMLDDGAHGDGAANDGVFGARTTNFSAGTKVRYYVEARSASRAKAASFVPTRAEQETESYRVALALDPAPSTPVVINELMASNSATLADPQGEFDDWIELRNLTSQDVDLGGKYLSDDPDNPRKWRFPDGTKIPSEGYLLVWADEDGGDAPGLHANFKLSAGGEQILLVDADGNRNALLDSVTFGSQESDRSYGRARRDENAFEVMLPTPGEPNN